MTVSIPVPSISITGSSINVNGTWNATGTSVTNSINMIRARQGQYDYIFGAKKFYNLLKVWTRGTNHNYIRSFKQIECTKCGLDPFDQIRWYTYRKVRPH